MDTVGGKQNPSDRIEADLDPAYRARRSHIAALAAGADRTPAEIGYDRFENATWTTAKRELADRWQRFAIPEVLDAAARLDLPTDRVPQLTEVTRRLRPRSGFEFRAVPGLVPVEEFFGALSRGQFLSTQYLRHHSSPLYTPEPDLIHEVLGHGTCLADPHLAMLHREAGAAMVRLETGWARQFAANVFWFSAEFGVVVPEPSAARGAARITTGARPRGPLAYGAGLLSSVGELEWFATNAEVRALDLTAMGTIDYDISVYQPVLFGARSLTEVLDVVGEFFATATDETIERRLGAATVATG